MHPFEKNREKVKTRMKERSVCVLFAGKAPYKRGDEHYPFSPDRNFYYVTGIERENCIFFLGQDGEGVWTTTLYIPRDNGPLAKWIGASLGAEEARERSAIDHIGFIDEFQGDFSQYLFRHQIETVLLDLENRDWAAAANTGVAFAKEVMARYPSISLVDLYPIFGDLRLIKEAWELERIRRAVAITEEGFFAMMKHVRPGMREYEVEAQLAYVLTKNGVRQNAFAPIVAAGARGTILHYGKNNEIIKDGDLVLVDAGAQVDWYNGDISRTFPANGVFSEQQKMVYNIVLGGQEKVISAIRPGVPFDELNKILRGYYVEELKNMGLAETDEALSEYYYHGVSHFLGAETHDIGRYTKRNLEAGMVLTVEPGLYIPQWNIGIRIEDDILVTAEGCEVLTKQLPRRVEEIEGFMAKGRSL